jgi:hypothetical protein
MEHVTREEFTELRRDLARLSELSQACTKLTDDVMGILDARLSRAERLLDGVKDAVLFVADNTADIVAFDGETIRVHSAACDIIAKSQQPPASAEGVEA